MRLGYFPGCSLAGSSREFDESLHALAATIGLELVEVPDWNCCGASSAHAMGHLLSMALPARILALAEKTGLGELLVPCSACYNRLISVAYELGKDARQRQALSDLIEMKVEGTVRVRNILEVLQRALAGNPLSEKIRPLERKVACYYGCLLVRPPKVVAFDRPEDPQSMDDLMRLIGAEPIDWAFKVECCGGGMTIPKTDLAARLSAKILEDAVSRGAELIVTACPMCHANLDLRRADIERCAGRRYSIPVLYITQAFGLAYGIDRRRLGLDRHLVPVSLEPSPAS